MQKFFIITGILLLSFSAYPQQDPEFAHNMFNKVFTNPGSAGMDGKICANVINRRQWVGFEGAPVTTLASVNSDLNLFGFNGGVGLSITDDRLGVLKSFQAKLAVSYHIDFAAGKLGIGLEAGLVNNDLESGWQPPETSPAEDPLIPENAVRKITFDAGLGAFYTVNEKLYIGVSVSHIHQPRINYPDVTSASFLRRHYYATAGYNLRFFDSPIELQPSVFIKSDGTTIDYITNLTGLYNKVFWLGVSYSNKEALTPMIGFKLFSGLRVGYSYELSLNKLISHSKGTHEVFIGYCFDIGKTNSKYKYRCIRYL
jgi:type IX secretion system PorP/SprF family membrane protein